MIQLRYQANPQTLEQFFATDIKLNVPEIMNHFFNQLPDITRQRIRSKLKQSQMFVNEIDTYSPDYAYLITQYGWDVLRDELSYESTFTPSQFVGSNIGPICPVAPIKHARTGRTQTPKANLTSSLRQLATRLQHHMHII